MASASAISIDYTTSATPSSADSHSPKRVFKGVNEPTSNSLSQPKKPKGKGKGPNGECCGCGGENCDNKDKKKYSDW